jgi:sRNA-binding carbon storage regulator CsrA
MNKITLRIGENIGIGYESEVILTLLKIYDDTVDLAVKSSKNIPVYSMEDPNYLHFRKLDQQFQKARNLTRRRKNKKT